MSEAASIQRCVCGHTAFIHGLDGGPLTWIRVRPSECGTCDCSEFRAAEIQQVGERE